MSFQVAFDFIAVFVALLNSFHRPYRQGADVLSSLRRDGAIWFIVSTIAHELHSSGKADPS